MTVDHADGLAALAAKVVAPVFAAAKGYHSLRAVNSFSERAAIGIEYGCRMKLPALARIAGRGITRGHGGSTKRDGSSAATVDDIHSDAKGEVRRLSRSQQPR
jgi:hypothetical protein